LAATLPLVSAHLDEISELFYRKLFAAIPSLHADLFNQSAQASGAQHRALAGAVHDLAAALLAEDLEPIVETVGRIANKHASVGISATHYTLARAPLFDAIGEVLGSAVTPEVAAAWGEAWQLMCERLIGAESALYESAGVKPGQIWAPFIVVDKREEAPGVFSFTIDGGEQLRERGFAAGQYTSVSVISDAGPRQLRQYTLHRAGVTGLWRFTVQRRGAVSTHLIDRIGVGSVLTASLPMGPITLDATARPVAIVTAGMAVPMALALLQGLHSTQWNRIINVTHIAAEEIPHLGEIEACLRDMPRSSVQIIRPEDWRDGVAQLAGIHLHPASIVYVAGTADFTAAAREVLISKGFDDASIKTEAHSAVAG
jgi:nitric oxide dioxygenase